MILFLYSKEDREFKKNIKTIRDVCRKLVLDRLNSLDKDDAKNDILGILLSDGEFKENIEPIVDETITFFFAGSFTLKSTNSNLI